MLMSRTGTARNQGTVERRFGLRVQWDSKANGLRMEAYSVQDFNTPAHHNYEFRMDSASLAKIFEVMVAAVLRGEGNGAVEAFAPFLPDILRMAVACSEAQELQSPKESPSKAA